MHQLHLRLLGICFSVVLPAGSVFADAWVCDAKGSAGFDSESGNQVVSFKTRASYIIRSGIRPEDLTFSLGRNDSAFVAPSETRKPASIQKVGNDIVEFCAVLSYPAFSDLSSGGVKVPSETKVHCDSLIFYGNSFVFSLSTGKFSLVGHGYQSSAGGQSWVEIGECRRMM